MNIDIKSDWWKEFFEGPESDVVLTTDAEDTVRFIKHIGEISNGMRVYDQCCGKGQLAFALASEGLEVTGIDFSEEFISFAKSNYNSKNLNFDIGNVSEKIFQEPFDIIINWNTSFAYSEDDEENEKMICCVGANLKKGGQFFFSMMNPLYISKNFQKFIVK